jgi:hypothetical protein
MKKLEIIRVFAGIMGVVNKPGLRSKEDFE